MHFFRFTLVALFFFSVSAQAKNFPMVRWTGAQDSNADLAHVISKINQESGKVFTKNDFLMQESRDLAFSKYQLFQQMMAGVPVEGKSIRIWTDLKTGSLIQMEASLDYSLIKKPGKESLSTFYRFQLGEEQTVSIAREAVEASEQDTFMQGLDWKDRVVDQSLIRVVTIKAKRGKHIIRISHATGKVVSQEYQEFPQADAFFGATTVDLDAVVYPIYEEVENSGQLLQRVPAKLTRVFTEVQQVGADPYLSLKARRYFEDQYSPVLGNTPEGRAQGYWSMAYVKNEAAKIRAALSMTANTFSKGLLLQGEYANINIHPDAFKSFKGINFSAKASAPFFPNWVETQRGGKTIGEMIPGNAFYGKPIFSAQELLNRPARRLSNHDPVSYLNDGFDEIQVYYAVNTFMEQLRARGFLDPDLSTRPFNAFLFNPDVEYRDNAYYTDDTINFTTYSDKQQNMARDNSTIWHELGHGIMDRVMGDRLQLADTGGLSEGMADFMAQIIVQAVTNNVAFPGSNQFRIINQTGFFLTNEVHDDGEAYGGAMNDFMMATVKKDGMTGVHKIADVILEAMRLCRDHPALTAKEWFNHVLFADQLGRPGLRQPGELSSSLLAALNGRNFDLSGTDMAKMSLVNDASKTEVVAGKPGSRNKPVLVKIAKNQTAHFDLSVKLESSKGYRFVYPLTVKVEFQAGALQGAVHWMGKEKGPRLITLNNEADTVRIPLDVSGTCDAINRQDGTCVDYAYVQILNAGEKTPRAKKRFYVQVKNP